MSLLSVWEWKERRVHSKEYTKTKGKGTEAYVCIDAQSGIYGCGIWKYILSGMET